MRECTTEDVAVYEAKAETMAELLSELAATMPDLEADSSWVNVDIYMDIETANYSATVYVHR